MAVYLSLILVAVGVMFYFLLAGGDNGGDSEKSSRFEPLHTFATADFHSLAISPDEPGGVLFGYHGGLQVSEDGGANWAGLVEQQGWDAMNTVIDPFTPQTIYAAGHNVFYRSNDAGATWQAVQPDLPNLDLHTFAASVSAADRLYAVPAGAGLYSSEDGGATWELVSNDVPPDTSALVELPDGTLILAATDQGLLRSEDGGQTWTSSRTGIDSGIIFTVRASASGDRLYAGTNNGLYASTDGGLTWTATLLDDVWAVIIGVDPNDPLHVMVINTLGELYVSRDGGQTWG